MKDFSQLKVTLSALSELQADIVTKKETALEWYNNYSNELKDYTKITDDEGNTAYFRRDNNGGSVDCSKWDYEYALERVNQEKRAVEAYTAILDYLDNFKF